MRGSIVSFADEFLRQGFFTQYRFVHSGISRVMRDGCWRHVSLQQVQRGGPLRHNGDRLDQKRHLWHTF